MNVQMPSKFLIFLVVAVTFSFGGYFWAIKRDKAKTTKPHIVLIIADDMGWNDVSFHGADQIPTPNIDALAYNGVILNRHYALPSCTPSRTSLLTSRYAIREGMQGWPLGAGEPRGVPLNSTLMPEYFRDLGYSTHLVGKWHLGYMTKDYTPASRGFDTFFGYYNGLITYFGYWVTHRLDNATERSGYDLHRDDPKNLMVPYSSKYFTDLITDEAVRIIKSNGDDKPLFLEIAHLAVHASENEDPLEVRNLTEVNATFPYIRDLGRRKYAGMMKAMDESVGRVVTALGEANMLDNSIIVFMSDNGAPTQGMYGNTGSNYPLRGIKMTLFEGGLRVAACVFSPLIRSASRVSSEPIHIVDGLPTLYTAAGGNVSDLRAPVDGLNLWPTIAKGAESPRKSMLLNIDEVNSGEAAMLGRHKLVKGSVAKDNDYYGESGNDPLYPTYKVKEALSSPAGLAIKKLARFNGPSLKKAQWLRERSTLRCLQARTQLNCSELCLFDIKNDPCETQDLSAQHPEIVKKLESLIEEYRRVMVPQTNTALDPCSDPNFFNGTYMPWRQTGDVAARNGECRHPKYSFF